MLYLVLPSAGTTFNITRNTMASVDTINSLQYRQYRVTYYSVLASSESLLLITALSLRK